MLDVPADVPPVLVALSVAATALLGVALAVRPTPAPRAAPLAATVDVVAASDHADSESRSVLADAIRLTPHSVSVRGDSGTAHASFAYGPVVPVREDTSLWRVLRGAPPGRAFDSPVGLATAALRARNATHRWRRDANRLLVRHVTWRGVDVTLVGA